MFVLNKTDLIIISLKIILFSPWYSWKIAELGLNNNHSHSLIGKSFTKGLVHSEVLEEIEKHVHKNNKRETLLSQFSTPALNTFY
jgi:hypothetical protein